MANVRMKDLQVPGLDNTYTFPKEAEDYSSSATYKAGEYRIQAGKLYKCKQDIDTAEVWTAAHWEEVNLGDEVSELKTAITFVEKGTGVIEAKEHAGYLLTSGAWEGTSSFHSLYTEIIPCVAGDVFWFKGYSANQIMFYADGVYNSKIQKNRKLAPMKVTIPSGVNGILFNSRAPIGTDVVFEAYKDGSNYDLLVKEIWKTNKLNSIYPKSENTGYVVGYNDNDGAVTYEGTSSYHNYTTEPIPCKPNDKFYYKGQGVSQNSALFLDDTMTLVSKIGYKTTDKYTEITIPANVYYVIFTSYAANANDIVFDLYADGSIKQNALYAGEITPLLTALTDTELNAVMTGKPLETFVVDGIMGTDS